MAHDQTDVWSVKPEAQWQKDVIDYAHLMGWYVAHFRTAQQGKRYITPVGADGRGFPDLVLVRERVVYAELKAPGKYPEPHQRVWHEKLRAAGAELYVWRPEHIEEMTRVLSRANVRVSVN